MTQEICLKKPRRVMMRFKKIKELEAFVDDLQGQALLDVVFSRLNLIETAYFGIRYLDQENQTVSTCSCCSSKSSHVLGFKSQCI
uniref:FERM N-terminal domain-containing protein n=1 Tax=Phlebotomus papatasi TaxID=29031 RepID=A0A1B0DQ26_PHLPP